MLEKQRWYDMDNTIGRDQQSFEGCFVLLQGPHEEGSLWANAGTRER